MKFFKKTLLFTIFLTANIVAVNACAYANAHDTKNVHEDNHNDLAGKIQKKFRLEFMEKESLKLNEREVVTTTLIIPSKFAPGKVFEKIDKWLKSQKQIVLIDLDQKENMTMITARYKQTSFFLIFMRNTVNGNLVGLMSFLDDMNFKQQYDDFNEYEYL